MTANLIKSPKTVGGTLLIGVGIVAGAILWWWGKDVYSWLKAKCVGDSSSV